MKINIQATNIELSDAIRDYLDKKIEGLDFMVDSETSEAVGQIELGKTTNHHRSGEIYRAEINIMTEGKYIRAVSNNEDLYGAIDEMKDQIFTEVKKYKSKQRSLIRRGGHKVKNMMRGLLRRNKRNSNG